MVENVRSTKISTNTVVIDVKTMRCLCRKNPTRMALLVEFLKCPGHISVAKFIRKKFNENDTGYNQNHLEHLLGDIKPLAAKLKQKKLEVEFIAIRVSDLLTEFMTNSDELDQEP